MATVERVVEQEAQGVQQTVGATYEHSVGHGIGNGLQSNIERDNYRERGVAYGIKHNPKQSVQAAELCTESEPMQKKRRLEAIPLSPPMLNNEVREPRLDMRKRLYVL